jgi:hypothetical protein
MSHETPARRGSGPDLEPAQRRRPPALDCPRCGSGLTPIALDAVPELAATVDGAADASHPSDAPCWLLRCDRCGDQSIWTDQ